MMNIKQITDNLLCSGCGTCNVICRHNAISMKKTPTMGLLFADIDIEKCADCGLCVQMCPSSHAIEEKSIVSREMVIGGIKGCYVGRSLDRKIFDNAQSGGMVTSILSYLFAEGLIDAVVSCRMEHGSPVPSVRYSILNSAEELGQNQKSCYTQVDIVSALNHIARYKNVAVVGVSCHIRGIKELMTIKKYDNIKYLIGLICDKSFSDTYMDALLFGEKKPGGKIRINYKQKNFYHEGRYYSYQQAPIVISNVESENTVVPNTKRFFFKNYFTVPKCNICWDKLNVRADISLGDPWGLSGKYDEKEGDSVVIVRSKSASDIVAKMKDKGLISISPVSAEDVANGQQIDARLCDIHNADWHGIVSMWEKSESMSKSRYLRIIYIAYSKWKIRVLLSRAKHLFTRHI